MQKTKKNNRIAENLKKNAGTLPIWLHSLREIKKLRTVVFCGLMAALAVVLNQVASFDVGPYIRIGFSGYPNRIVEYVFGAAIGGVFGGALDILKFIIKPSGTFFPGFTVNAILAGSIYGFFLYRKPVKIWRVLAAELLVKSVLNCGLNTLWLSMLYGKAFMVLLPARVLKNLIMLPIDTALLFALLLIMERTVMPMMKRDRLI